jgi:ribonuclease HI
VKITYTSYKGSNIYIISDSWAAIKAFDSFQTNSNLVWHCHQFLVKVAELNSIQLIWMQGHMGTDGNETADELARQGSSHPLIGHKSELGITAKVPGV